MFWAKVKLVAALLATSGLLVLGGAVVFYQAHAAAYALPVPDAAQGEPAPAQGVQAATNPLQVQLSVDKETYVIGEEIQFSRQVTNHGKSAVKLYPFVYMNDQLRFYWTNDDSLQTRRYGDGKTGWTPQIELKSGDAKIEILRDNILTQKVGTFLVFISCKFPAGERIESNVVRIRVVEPKPAAGERSPLP